MGHLARGVECYGLGKNKDFCDEEGRMSQGKRSKWEYLVGHFSRKGNELWFDSSHHGRVPLRGGVKGFAELLNSLGADGWELTHVDDTPPRTLVEAGAESVYAWGDMIFKRPG